MTSSLNRISFTGADDLVNASSLAAISAVYPDVEWALLYFDEKDNKPRVPSKTWREQFVQKYPTVPKALHLCGNQVFHNILQGIILPEFKGYARIQLNINTRAADFSDDELTRIYSTLLNAGHTLILQYHTYTQNAIHALLATAKPDLPVHVLFDASQGRGVLPTSWPQVITGVYCGFAGGLNPQNVATTLNALDSANRAPYWVDMETGVRTNNLFDLEKIISILRLIYGPAIGKFFNYLIKTNPELTLGGV